MSSASVTQAAKLKLVQEWVEAWNARDAARVLSHYDDGIVFTTPRAATAWQLSGGAIGDPSGVIRGIVALTAYFTEAAKNVPGLHIKVERVFSSANDRVAVQYTRETGATVFEAFRINPETGKVVEAEAYYDDPGLA